jgi:hypothetical protein
MTGDTKGGAEGHDEDPQQDDNHDSGLKDGPDDEPKRKKVMIRLLTARLDKLVAKKDDACVQVPLFSSIFSMYIHVAETFYQTISWNCPARRYGPSTTRQYLAR